MFNTNIKDTKIFLTKWTIIRHCNNKYFKNPSAVTTLRQHNTKTIIKHNDSYNSKSSNSLNVIKY